MGAIEKYVVNSRSHSTRVAEVIAARVLRVPHEPGMKLLDIGCGNGAAARLLRERYALDVTGGLQPPASMRGLPRERASHRRWCRRAH